VLAARPHSNFQVC